jgi:hypothetical protein
VVSAVGIGTFEIEAQAYAPTELIELVSEGMRKAGLPEE